MTSDERPERRPIRPVRVPRRRSPWAVAFVALALLVVGAVVLAQVWTEVAWYRALGFGQVWSAEWSAKAFLFAVAGLLAFGAVWVSLMIARRARPKVSAVQHTVFESYREQIRPIERGATVVIPVVAGLISGLVMASNWRTILAWHYRVPFGTVDAQFQHDLSFYVFTLPALTLFLDFALAILIVCLALSAFVHLLFGAITTGGRTFAATGVARVQLALLGSAVMIVIAVKIWVSRFSLVTKLGDSFDGANYADVNAVMPARGILAGIGLLVAALFLVVIFRSDWRIPIVGVVLMVVSWLVVGGVYPGIVQKFQVEPNAQELEAPFIQKNIDATLLAYGLDDIEVTQYAATTDAKQAALRADAQTTASIRLLDPHIVSPAFQQLQQNKQYYDFSDELSVDRYTIDGQKADAVVAVRELNLAGLSQENRTWINDHTVFTHGFGVVAAYGNRTNEDGQPAFFEGGIPPTGALGAYEPRIYFGRNLPQYSIVGAPEGTTPWELDYPDDASANGQVNTTYQGVGGPGIGSTFNKLMFWMRFGDEQILFSDRVTPESQVLYYRDPLTRVKKVAPYLMLDANVYPAVVDGRVLWIVDGFTTTDMYPYADHLGIPTGTGPDYQMNYIRNSVKATVDAFDGTVTLYAWDPTDPILQTWGRIYPDSLHPVSEISSDLMSHLRYPEDLFKIQRFELATYHVSDAASFYSGQDFWTNPVDPTVITTALQPPYYLTLEMPGQDAPTFSLTTTFIPGGNSNRNVLTGFLAVDSETGSVAGSPSADYGKLRLLELPRDTTVLGPGQMQNAFNSNTSAQNVLNLLRQGETDVKSGNLLTLPVGGGLLYVQPVYVQSSKGTQFPLLRKVFVAFGDSVGFADTLDEALDQLFGRQVPTTDPGTPDPGTTEPGTTDPGPTTSEQEAEALAALHRALTDAQAAIAAGQTALAAGDFAAYGEAQSRLQAALQAAVDAEAIINGAGASARSGGTVVLPSPGAGG